MDDLPVIIVGAGLAGLRCAARLAERDVPWLLLEASDGPGGRVRTDHVDGFQLDRGFQVLLTAYPQARAALDLAALDLHAFAPGAIVRLPDGFAKVSDPLRNPGAAVATLRAPVGSVGDKLRVARLGARLRRTSVDEVWRRPERTTRDALVEAGFGTTIIERLWRPLLAGVQLDPSLTTSSRAFEFVVKMLASGDNSLPAAGIQAIPDQLAARLPADQIRYNTTVVATDPTGVWLEDGTHVLGRRVVVAVDGPTASRLVPPVPTPASNGVMCLYFAAERPPIDEPLIVLDGADSGPVNNLCVPNIVAPAYAPEGVSLVSASVLGSGADAGELEQAVRDQLRDWFGRRVDTWRLLRHYDIRHAQPRQRPPVLSTPQRRQEFDGMVVCGDHRDDASINGALQSGVRAADAVLTQLSSA